MKYKLLENNQLYSTKAALTQTGKQTQVCLEQLRLDRISSTAILIKQGVESCRPVCSVRFSPLVLLNFSCQLTASQTALGEFLGSQLRCAILSLYIDVEKAEWILVHT